MRICKYSESNNEFIRMVKIVKTMIGLIAGKSGDSLTDELHDLGYQVALVVGKEQEPGTEKADWI